MSEAVSFHLLPSLLDVKPGVTAVVGSGGKTTLLATLAELLTAQAQGGARTSVVLATSTRMLPFPELPLYTGDSADELADLLRAHPVVCVGTPAEQGKLAASALPFSALAKLADYVLVEADGSKRLPLKAHAGHEPAVPREAQVVVNVVGASGFGATVREAAHRPELFCARAGCAACDPATAPQVAQVIRAEQKAGLLPCNLHVLVNQADSEKRLAEAAALRRALGEPALAASLSSRRLWRIA